LNKTVVFASIPYFKQSAVLHQNRLHKKKDLAGPVQAVCGLQDSSFHDGWRNTPKAVK
jgi:hypothetical protein